MVRARYNLNRKERTCAPLWTKIRAGAVRGWLSWVGWRGDGGKGFAQGPIIVPTSTGYIQACRALMITAILLGFLGLFLGMVGLRCTNIGGMVPSRKAKLAATAGALHILAGVCGMVAISWYAFNITRDFFDPLYPGTK